MTRTDIKPQYSKGQWVKFYLGEKRRIMRGCISDWWVNSFETVIYDISRNKQTFRGIYETDIIGAES